ncbi:MAG TPA: peptidyl-prolyl cis-trans isomerase [Candidatus Hydrogenedentes bacterium]|nr:peptidyl-prolyl cis-trans isomerase [Candidatus Hydrogenedentota bacterium]HQE82788.1 peptidyl-prolyl cis-trans isomerase [Candidatus Hydrogenedentota bacterium]HQH52484.1 peptidyl-prolyl cis-trans isomerase [Candidatus Hydrogenedentota bacterium]HQM47916.1 peptidyl-prolyl cis-trans isomerase [Candidatus Hydrogenedentota bacterium]
MSENTPERLKAFREETRERSRRATVWPFVNTVLLIAGFACVIAAIVMTSKRGGTVQQVGGGGGLTNSAQREYATLLEQKGLTDAAIDAYEDYLENAPLEPDARANVCYSVGKLAIEAERYEKALEFLYQAEMLDPDSPVKDEINGKVVLCLEKLGRSSDLRRELRKRTAPERTAADLEEGEVVLAEFGGQVITDRDLEREIEKLPPAARESFDSPEKRTEFLQNIVAERLLLDKALRLELDKEPEVQEELAQVRDGLIVRRLIDQEVNSKISITPEDVRRFYEAEIERFTEPATRMALVGSGDSADSAKEDLAKARNDPERATKVVVRDGQLVQGLGDAEHDAAVLEAVKAAEPGAVSEPVQLGSAWYVFGVTETPAKVHAFEDVQAQAERMLRVEKQREQFQALVAETLKARSVQLYPERLKEDPPKK